MDAELAEQAMRMRTWLVLSVIASASASCGRFGYGTVTNPDVGSPDQGGLDGGRMDLGSDLGVDRGLPDQGLDVSLDVGPDVPGPGQSCSGGGACGPNLQCFAYDGGLSSCARCGDLGERCCNDTTCMSGLSCLPRTTAARSFCMNPAGTAGGTGAPCLAGMACNSTTTEQCSAFGGSAPGSYCIRCGDVGWPCCLGNNCTTGTCETDMLTWTDCHL